MNEHPWQVKIISGAPDEALGSAPMKFGTPEVTLGVVGSASVPLIYGPVDLFGYGDELCVRNYLDEAAATDGRIIRRAVDHRTMYRPRWEAEGPQGGLRVFGFEETPTGLTRAVWEVLPYEPPPNDCEDCGHQDDWHTRLNGDDHLAADGRGACISQWTELLDSNPCGCLAFKGPIR